jgi:phenylpropionate dioxygenase-like ring-hydroxylating dioxygenase large terminal subunit
MRAEDQARLVHVGPGQPAGEWLRRYWQPACLSTEVPERDGAPVRVRLLGEDLIAYRDSDGAIGLVDAYCPHRRAPLFFGRNEECGLRCVYHGWKFNAAGDCVDLPSEPASSPMKNSIHIKAYPTVERGGIVWAYMGPADRQPPAPDYEWTRAPGTHRAVSKNYQDNNYLQSLEGGLDTTHVGFLHNSNIRDKSYLFARDNAPKIECFETPYGYSYTGTRQIGGDDVWVRHYQYIMPVQQMRPNVRSPLPGANHHRPAYDGHIWVPVDDDHTCVYNWTCGYDESAPIDSDGFDVFERRFGRGRDAYIPGTFRLKANMDNDYKIDRALQKTTSFTGIPGINTQDVAVQEGMGPIVDRTQEHLGTSDRAIVFLRRMLLEAVDAVERGETPPGVDPLKHRDVRPHEGILKDGGDWREAFAVEGAARW